MIYYKIVNSRERVIAVLDTVIEHSGDVLGITREGLEYTVWAFISDSRMVEFTTAVGRALEGTKGAYPEINANR